MGVHTRVTWNKLSTRKLSDGWWVAKVWFPKGDWLTSNEFGSENEAVENLLRNMNTPQSRNLLLELN